MTVVASLVAGITSVGHAAPHPISLGELNAGVGLTGGVSLSPDGQRAIFPTNKGQALLNVTTGKLANVDKGWFAVADQPACAWSPTGDRLALTVYREGLATLQIWSAETGQAREVLAMPRALYLRLPPVWSPDGNTLYFVINQNLPWARSDPRDDVRPTVSNNVLVQASGRYDLTEVRERFVREYPEAYAEANRSLVIALDVASGRFGVLGKGNDIETLYLSPDGRHLVAAQPRQNVPGREARWTKQVLVDLYLFSTAAPATLPGVDLEKMEDRMAGWSDAAGKRVEPILRDLHLNTTGMFLPPLSTGSDGQPQLTWSPDSTRFAFATVGRRSTGDVFVYDVASRQLRNLTEAVTLPVVGAKTLGYAEHYRFNYNSHKFGGLRRPLWTPDGRGLVVTGAGDAWMISTDGASAPRKLTESVPFEALAIVPAGSSGVVALSPAGTMAVVARDRVTRTDSVWRVGATEAQTARVSEIGLWTRTNLQTDATGGRMVMVGLGPNADSNLYRVDLGEVGALTPITRFRAGMADAVFPETRVLHWTTPAGSSAYGVLTLPAGASAECKVPLIVTGYPGAPLSTVDSRMRSGPRFYSERTDGYLRDGIAVFEADLPISDEGTYAHVMREVVGAVGAATDAAVATGVIDASRLGLEGASFGGFMVQAVISQTDRFKAAVSVAGVGNWASSYLGAGMYGPRYHEEGQGRLVVPLWEDPTRYLENSPLAYWDKVRTPLLLIHGEQDTTVPMERSEEALRGLQHLGRDGVLARYRRMGHQPDQEAEQRMRVWFREHLLGREAKAHLAELGSLLLGDTEDGAAKAPAAISTQP